MNCTVDEAVAYAQALVARRKFESEADVKRAVRDILNWLGACAFMPATGGYGRSGVSDFVAVLDGAGIAIETKFGANKPTPLQLQFGAQWRAAGGFFAVVSEASIVQVVEALVSHVVSLSRAVHTVQAPASDDRVHH